jgi:DNA polymerase-3 subunit delta'
VSFDEIVGQVAACEALRAALEGDRVPGGYLFLGARGVGKFRTARALARALLCEGEGPLACGTCSSCHRVAHRVHPNLHVVGEGDEVAAIKIEEIRETRDRLSLRPMEGSRQVVIVDNADRMREEAGNALLKTLEEPPPGAVLVLVVAEALRVLDTIRSRCQVVRFVPLDPDQVRAVLEDRAVPRDEAAALARHAGGSPGRALALRRLGFPDRAGPVLDRFLDLGRDDPVAVASDLTPPRGKTAEERIKARLALEEILRLLAHLARDALRSSVGAADVETTVPPGIVARALERFGRDPAVWGRVGERLLEGARDVKANVSVDLVMVDLLLDVERAWTSPSRPPSSRPRSGTAR